MTVVNACTRWMPRVTLTLVAAIAIISGACGENRPAPAIDEPPFEGLDRLVELSDLSII